MIYPTPPKQFLPKTPLEEKLNIVNMIFIATDY